MHLFEIWRQIRNFSNQPETKRETYNLEQKAVNKFTKLSKVGFSTECFTLTFCDFLPKNVKIWLLG